MLRVYFKRDVVEKIAAEKNVQIPAQGEFKIDRFTLCYDGSNALPYAFDNNFLPYFLPNNELAKAFMKFSFYDFVPRKRIEGEYRLGQASASVRDVSKNNTGLYMEMWGESLEDGKELYRQIMAGKIWPILGGNWEAEQCRKPILQARYHVREAVRIIRERIVAYFRRWFRR